MFVKHWNACFVWLCAVVHLLWFCVQAKEHSEAHPLNHGDRVVIGATTFELHIHSGMATCVGCIPQSTVVKEQQLYSGEWEVGGEGEVVVGGCNEQICKTVNCTVFNEGGTKTKWRFGYMRLVWEPALIP